MFACSVSEKLCVTPTTLQLNELESIAGLFFRALESSNHDVRCAVALLLGGAAAAALTLPKLDMSKSLTAAASANQALTKGPSAEEGLSIISTGFLRGGGGFLKETGKMTKGPAATSREVRVGVTMSYVVMVNQLGSTWFERRRSSSTVSTWPLSRDPDNTPLSQRRPSDVIFGRLQRPRDKSFFDVFVP